MHRFYKTIHRITGIPTLHVIYHIVTDDDAPHIRHLYPIRSVGTFRNDLDYLLKHFIPVTLDELVQNKQFARPGFHISFDDGLRQCSEIIRPVLLEKGIPATFFINPDFVDNRALMFRYTASLIAGKRPDLKKDVLSMRYEDSHFLEQLAADNDIDIKGFLQTYRPYMTSAQIRELAFEGFQIGAHSLDHPMYAHLPVPQQIHQTLESIARVRDEFGVENPPFAFPFTDYGVPPAFFRQIPDDICTFGCAGVKKELEKNHFQRLAIEKSTAPMPAVIMGAYVAALTKFVLGKHITRRG